MKGRGARRRLHALPWGGGEVRVRLTIRRFDCADPLARRTFAEAVGPRIAPCGRRTAEATNALLAVASGALGGRAGVRL